MEKRVSYTIPKFSAHYSLGKNDNFYFPMGRYNALSLGSVELALEVCYPGDECCKCLNRCEGIPRIYRKGCINGCIRGPCGSPWGSS
jgi:hypothetical protein